ncbi:hypothetical protein BDR07DRAFT_1391430 [Suillus spraguei]|nr:hypothetical protein BDR07DRAFT_1391430 [Suillus spraguei]
MMTTSSRLCGSHNSSPPCQQHGPTLSVSSASLCNSCLDKCKWHRSVVPVTQFSANYHICGAHCSIYLFKTVAAQKTTQAISRAAEGAYSSPRTEGGRYWSSGTLAHVVWVTEVALGMGEIRLRI